MKIEPKKEVTEVWTQRVAGGLPEKKTIETEIPQEMEFHLKVSAHLFPMPREVRTNVAKLPDVEPQWQHLYGARPEEILFKAHSNLSALLAAAIADSNDSEEFRQLLGKFRGYMDLEKMFPDSLKVWAQPR